MRPEEVDDCIHELLRLYEEEGKFQLKNKWPSMQEHELASIEAKITSHLDPSNSMVIKVRKEDDVIILQVEDAFDRSHLWVLLVTSVVAIGSAIAMHLYVH